MREPAALAVGADGSLFISDHHNDRVRRVSPDGVITTVAGGGSAGGLIDCGQATEANLEPWGLADHAGILYVVDMLGNRVRIVVP